MFCTKCGYQNKQDSNFCKYCGDLINSKDNFNNTPKKLSTNSLQITAVLFADSFYQCAKKGTDCIFEYIETGKFDLLDRELKEFKKYNQEKILFLQELTILYSFFIYSQIKNENKITEENMQLLLNTIIFRLTIHLKIKKDTTQKFKEVVMVRFNKFEKSIENGNLSDTFFENVNNIFWPEKINQVFKFTFQNLMTIEISILYPYCSQILNSNLK